MSHSIPSIPVDVPQKGETYQHYKGNFYRVLGLGLDADDRWVVVYEPRDKKPDSIMFTRPASEWRQVVEWEGKKHERFTKVDNA